MAGRKWTQEKIIETILRLHEEGVDLSPTGIRKTHSALFSSARSKSHFGSWRAAVTAAGLDYSKVKRGEQVWSPELIIEGVRKAYEAGEDLLSVEFKNRNKKLYSAACAKRYFGSWRKTLTAAGLDYEHMRAAHFWSKPKIIAKIRELHQQGEPLNWSNISKICPGLYRAARRKENFGSWRNALKAAGFDPGEPRKTEDWSKDKIVREIERLYEEGHDLSQKNMLRTHGALLAAAKSRRYFGTWEKAIKAAGLDYEEIKLRGHKPNTRGEADE